MKLPDKPTICSFTLLPVAAAFVLLSAPPATAAYSDVVLSDHPVAYYRLEELPGAGTAADSGPNAFNAIYSYDLDTNGVPDFPVLGIPGIDTNCALFTVYNDADSVRP